MIDFPFNEISGLTMKLHNMQKGADRVKGHYVYRVSIEPSACSFEVHMSVQMFGDALAEYRPGSYKIETTFLNESVHLSATVDGSITLVCCILKYDMVQSPEDLNKCIQQLYDEWVERTGWPYV